MNREHAIRLTTRPDPLETPWINLKLGQTPWMN